MLSTRDPGLSSLFPPVKNPHTGLATSLSDIAQMLGEAGISYQRSQDYITMN